MELGEFVHNADFTTGLTARQAEALYRRHAAGESREAVAAAMGCTPSNVDNLERAARSKIITAHNLVGLASSIDATPDPVAYIATCTHCDEPTTEMRPDPTDDRPIEEMRMVCPDCAAVLVTT